MRRPMEAFGFIGEEGLGIDQSVDRITAQLTQFFIG